MSIKLDFVYPPQPSTERARRTPLVYDSNKNLIAYGSGKLVIVRSVELPDIAHLVYGEHLSPVTTLEFSPSGFYIASGDSSGQVRVWNTVGDEIVTKGPYQATSGKLNGIAWCHESSRILAVGDGKERFGHGFTADSGNTIGEISGHSAEINAVAIKPNRPMRAVTVGEDGNTVFYEGPPFRFSRSVSKHTNSVSDVAFSPDGSFFITGGCDRKLGLYDGNSGDFLKWIEANHDGMVLSVTFASASSVLSASADCSVRLTDINNNKLLKTWQLPKELQNQQTGVIGAGEDLAISVGLNGDLYYWKQSSDKPVRVEQGHQKQVTALALTPLKSLYSGSIDGSIICWDSKFGGSRLGIHHEGPVSGLVGDLWSAGWDSKIHKIGGSETLETKKQPLDVAYHEKYFLTVSDQSLELVGTDKTVELDRGTSIHAVDDLVAVGHGIYCALFSLPNLELVHKFDGRQAEVSAVQFSPDKKLLAVGDSSGKILLYSTADFSLVTSRWTFHTSRVTSIRWTEDSKRVVTGALDTNIFIFNIERPGRAIKFLGAHKDGVTQAIWDGENIVTGGADGSIKRWTVSL